MYPHHVLSDDLTFASLRVKSDLIVLPCDFIPPPNLTLSSLLDAHRMDADGPILTSLLYERGETTKDGASRMETKRHPA